MQSNNDYTPVLLKRCSKCKLDLPRNSEYFPKNRYNKDGYAVYCKSCCNKDGRDRYARNADAIKKKHNEFRATRRDETNEKNRDYYRRNRDKVRLKNSIWWKSNPDKTKVYYNEYIQRIKSLPNTLSRLEWEFSQEYFGNRCAYCGEEFSLDSTKILSMDHFIPVTNSDCPGTVAENIVPVCYSCNSSKHNEFPTKWLIRRFGSEEAGVIEARVLAYLSKFKREPTLETEETHTE